MTDFLRSMRGEAGPRVARAAIKRLRLWRVWAALVWIAVCAFLLWLLGIDWVRDRTWLGISAVLPLFPLLIATGCCETQIRHFNDLALSPFESGRMDASGAKRMWLGNLSMLGGAILIVTVVTLAQRSADFIVETAMGVACAMIVAGYVLTAYKTGLGWFSPRGGPSYDPDEDEWTFGLGSWWRRD